MRHAMKRWLLAVFVVLILYLGLGESVGQSPFWNQIDKGIHFLLFGVLSLLFVVVVQQTMLFRLPFLTRWMVLIPILSIACLVGELVHLVIPGRTFEWGDMFANFSGAAVFGAMAAILFTPKNFIFSRPEPEIPESIRSKVEYSGEMHAPDRSPHLHSTQEETIQ